MYQSYVPNETIVRPFDHIADLSTRLVANAIAQPEQLFDAQPPEDRAKGSIPGSININWKDTLNEDLTFKTPEEIRTLVESAGGDVTDAKTKIGQCLTGVTACILLASLRHAGLKNIALYDGSYKDWEMRTQGSL
jgi:thiosulfate/3-mercaptopyruvate sulfurtransferase